MYQITGVITHLARRTCFEHSGSLKFSLKLNYFNRKNFFFKLSYRACVESNTREMGLTSQATDNPTPSTDLPFSTISLATCIQQNRTTEVIHRHTPSPTSLFLDDNVVPTTPPCRKRVGNTPSRLLKRTTGTCSRRAAPPAN